MKVQAGVPVYVSCGNDLSEPQQLHVASIQKRMERDGIAWTTLGKTFYSAKSPIESVLEVIPKCHGGIIFGFARIRLTSGVIGPGSTREK